MAKIPKAHTEMVAAAFRSIFALSDPAEIEARYDEVTDLLAGHGFTKAAASMRSARHDVLEAPRVYGRLVCPESECSRGGF